MKVQTNKYVDYINKDKPNSKKDWIQLDHLSNFTDDEKEIVERCQKYMEDNFSQDMKSYEYWKKKHCSTILMKKMKKNMLLYFKERRIEMFGVISATVDSILKSRLNATINQFTNISDVRFGNE